MNLRCLAAGLALIAVFWVPSVTSAEGTSEIDRARRLLDAASTEMREARKGQSRLAALGHAVSAHEEALSALRSGLRELAASEQNMTSELNTETVKLRNLLVALQSLSRAPTSALLSVQGGPVETTRSAMLIAGITPELNRRVSDLGQRLDLLQALRNRQDEARTEARDALASLQELRARTTKALAERDTAGLVAQSELRGHAKEAAMRANDLNDLASALRNAGIESEAMLLPAPLPVAGRVSAGFGEPDPWGRPGKGWSIEAPAFAQITAPWDATVRYAGPLIDYGQVVVLEPAADYLVVIAGLAHIDRTAGEAVLAGEKLGDLGGPLPTSDEFLLDQTEAPGQIRQETLYLEIRRSGKLLDPADWFDATGSEAIR